MGWVPMLMQLAELGDVPAEALRVARVALGHFVALQQSEV